VGISDCPPDNFVKARKRFEGLKQNRSLYSLVIEMAISNGENDKAVELIDKVAAFDEANADHWK